VSNFLTIFNKRIFRYLLDSGVRARQINKLDQGRPHIEDAIKNGEIQLVINTGTGDTTRRDGYVIRRAALKFSVSYVTTLAGAMAVSKAVAALKAKALTVRSLQDYHRTDRRADKAAG
jgi:carbamoyl-phosphate synthase large subunit